MTQKTEEKRREEDFSILYQYTIPKTKQLVLKPKPDGSWDVEINAFRELHARNQIEISETLMEKAVRPFLREHHWPPGNSQTLLFQKKPSKVLTCGRCKHQFKSLTQAVFRSGQTLLFCDDCLAWAKKHNLVRRVVQRII